MQLQHLLSDGISLEEIEDELEHVFFVKLSDLSELEKADKVEKMFQSEYFLVDSESGKRIGLQRTREVALGTELGDESNEITLTLKIFNDQGGNRGHVCVINRDMQDAFKHIADRNIEKTRYIFKVPGSDHVWEIDLVKGVKDNWVKVDYEVKSRYETVPQFPLAMDQMIDVSFGKSVTDEESKILDQIFKEI